MDTKREDRHWHQSWHQREGPNASSAREKETERRNARDEVELGLLCIVGITIAGPRLQIY